MTRSRPVLFGLAATAFLALAACSGSSTEPLEAPLFFEGEVGFMGSATHNFTVLSEGLLRFEMVRLQQKVVEGVPPPPTTLAIGLGVGRPTGDACSARYSVLIRDGGLAVLSLSGADFCVRIFDSGNMFPGQVVEYALSVSPN